MTQLHVIKSTTVRSNHSPLLEVLANLAPGAASAVGEALFTRPRRHPRPERERAYLATASRVSLRSRGVELAAWQWGSGERTTLLVHGWQGRGSQLGPLVEPLVSAGHRVIAFDAPAHGDSPGRSATIASFRDAILDAEERLGRLDAVVAHSMGGAALALALQDGLSVSAAALVAPPVSPVPTIDALAERLALGDEARRRLFERIERRVGMSPRDVDLRRVARRFRVPALVVHDRDDRFVPWASGQAVAAAWPGARLVSTEGLGHGRILSDAHVTRLVARFVLDETPRSERRDLDRWLDAVEGRRIATPPEVATRATPGARPQANALPASSRRAKA